MTIVPIILLILCSFVAAFGLTTLLVKIAPKFNLLQQANARSSHTNPTPTGGGVSFAVLGLLGGLYLSFLEPDLMPFIVFAGLLSLVGFLDDLFEVPALWRFGIQFLATAGLIWVVGTLSLITDIVGENLFLLAAPICLLAAVWWLNLVNFVDGIDGLVATQSSAIIICISLLAHLVAGLPFGIVELWGLLVCGAILGFVLLNFPPAKIFMGDAGSYFIAAALFSLFLYSTAKAPQMGIPWLLLAIPLTCDASATLFIRVMRREKWYAPHRQHVYQRLSRQWASHRAATLAYLALTIVVFLPLAALSLMLPFFALLILLLSYATGVTVFMLLGAGQPDKA